MEGDAPSLESCSLPFRQAFLEGLKSPLLTLGCRSGVPVLAAPHSWKPQPLQEQAVPTASQSRLPPASSSCGGGKRSTQQCCGQTLVL